MATQRTGEEFAELGGWANEVKGNVCNNQPPDEALMDYHNNAQGRDYADGGDCMVSCEEGLDNGDLIYDIKPADHYWD